MTKKKKIGIFIIAFIMLFFVTLILIPILFKSKIKDSLLNSVNQKINANLQIEDYDLGLFKNFPNATLSLKNTILIGTNDFANDTLLQAKEIAITINLKSLFGNNYEVKDLKLSDAYIETKLDKKGHFNWDIMKSKSHTSEMSDTTNNENGDFVLSMNNIEIKNTTFRNIDLGTNTTASLLDINAKLSGDFAAKETNLNLKATSKELIYTSNNISYLSKIKVDVEAIIHADFEHEIFRLEKNKLYFNDLHTTIEGSLGIIDDGYHFDLKLKAPEANFSQILSLTPSIYDNKLETIKTSGSVSLDTHVIGDYTTTNYPNINLSLSINDAMFQYPNLPKSIQDINLDLSINGKPSSIDNLKIAINKFGFRIENNSIDGNFTFTPVNDDVTIKGKLKGRIDLSTIKEVYPLEKNIQLEGNIESDLNFMANKSSIIQKNYKNITNQGTLSITNLLYETLDFPQIKIKKLNINFDETVLDIQNLDLLIGKSDISANGKLENTLGYLLDKQQLKGILNLKSNLLDVDDIMSHSTSNTIENDSTNTESKIETLPANIDFEMTCDINLLRFNKINISHFSAKAKLSNGMFTLSNTNANLFGGTATFDGTYTDNTLKPQLKMDLNLLKVSFAETFKNTETIQTLAPIFQDISGTYTMKAKLDANPNDLLQTLYAKGTLESNNFTLEGNSTLKKLGTLLKIDKLDRITTKNITIPFEIKDGTLFTPPFSATINDDIKLNMEGYTKLDQSINYKGTIGLPSSMSNAFISNIPFRIQGDFDNTTVDVDTEALAAGTIDNVISNFFGKSKDDSNSSSISDSSNTNKSKADQLRQSAKEKSDLIIKNAGSNPLAKAAAKTAAQEVIKQAEKEARKLDETNNK